MDYNNQEEIKMNNNINNNINNSKNEYDSFNSRMLFNSLNQPLKKGEIPRESGDTIEIIEKKYFQYRENSKDLSKSDSQEEEKFENEENPFYQPKIGEENNNNNLNGLIMNENNNRNNNNNINNNISNNNKISYINNNNNNNNILNEKSYIYNINGNLYSFLGEKNFVSEDNIIISDLNKYNDFQK